MNGVLPIFAVVVVGYLLGFRKTFSSQDAGSINKLVFMVAIPALSVDLIVNTPFAEFDWRVLFGFFLAELATYLIGFLIARKLLKCALPESILLGLASSFGNLFGDIAALPLVAIIAVDSVIIFGGTLMAMEAVGEGSFSWPQFTLKIVSNPPIMSLLIGLALVVFGTELPASFLVFLKFAGSAASPCALFALGIVLSQVTLGGRASVTLMICVAKLAVLPVIAGVILLGVLALDFETAKVPLMAAAAPCGAMAFVLALNYKVRTDAIAPAILFSTLISLVSLSLLAAH